MDTVRPLHRILVVGVGSIGHRHVRCFKATGRATISLCETNADLRSQIAAKYGVDAAFADLDAALADPPEAAVIATPAPLHVPQAITLAAAGVHLLIEKPLSTSLDGIDTLRDLVERKKLLAAVAYVFRSDPVLVEMKEAIDSGRFGRPLHLTVQCGENFPAARPSYRNIYYRDRASGGGAVQDSMTHLFNIGEWLVGPIDRLTADGAHLSLEGVTVEDTVNVLARHGEVLACYSLNHHQAPDETTVTVVCQRGTCRYEAHKLRWRWMVSPGNDWTDQPHEPFDRDAWFSIQAALFLDVLEGRIRPRCTLDEGLHTLRCNLATLASIDHGGWREV
jgi:predicted dehydrogenase